MSKYKCDRQTLTEVLKVRPAFWVDKKEQKSLGIWTESIMQLWREAEEKDE